VLKSFLCLLTVVFFFNIVQAQENITWGGYSIITKDKDKDLFPNFNALREKMAPMQYKYINSLEKPYLLSPRGSQSSGETKSIVVAFDKERVTGGKLGDMCLWQYTLSAQVILFELENMSVLQTHPVGRSRNYVDNDLSKCSSKERDKQRDKFRFCQIFLGLETDENYSNQEFINNCENISLNQSKDGLIKEIGQVVSGLSITDKKNRRFAGIGSLTITDRAKGILSGKENFIPHPFFTDENGVFDDQSYKDWVSQYFAKTISSKLDVPLVVPFAGSVGGKVQLKYSDGTEIDLTLPELDFSFDITIRGFAKSLMDETSQREAWVYGSYLTVDFGGPISKVSSKVKNGYVFETVKGDFLNDWREFDNSVQQLTQQYSDQIVKTEKRWVADKTNLKYKESKEYFIYIKEKLASAR
jgi:hypothetical protein